MGRGIRKFFGNLKSECALNAFESKEEAYRKIRDCIVMFYNKDRLLSYLECKSPVEYEKLNL
jgi:Integrase core domain